MATKFSRVRGFLSLICTGMLLSSCFNTEPLTPPPSANDDSEDSLAPIDSDTGTGAQKVESAQENGVTDGDTENATIDIADAGVTSDDGWSIGADSAADTVSVDTESTTAFHTESIYGTGGANEPGCFCPIYQYTPDGNVDFDTDMDWTLCDCDLPAAIEADSAGMMCLRGDTDSARSLEQLTDTEAIYHECYPDEIAEMNGETTLWQSDDFLVIAGADQRERCVRFGDASEVPMDMIAFTELPIAEALSEATAAMTGSWIGHADPPDAWLPPSWDISITLKADGNYVAMTNRDDTPPFYYGSVNNCNELRRWELTAVNTDGIAGIVDVPFEYYGDDNGIECDLPSWQGQIQNIAVNADRTRLTFEFMTDRGHGPVQYDLRKVCPEMDTDTQ